MMKPYGLIVATAIAVFAPQLARAQEQPADVKLTPMQLSIACAIPPATVVPGAATLHVIGAQDTIPRTTFAERDLLVIDAGTDKGVQLDQHYFVRRPVRPGLLTGAIRRAVQTAGWIRIVAANDLLLYSLEVTGAGCYWVEFSRPLIRGKISPRTQAMADAYPEALEAARKLMRAGELASHVHRVVAQRFTKHGFALGHLSGHSIGTTMLEYPAIGENSDVVLQENMIFSLHPQVVDQNGKVCLYTQDTYRIGKLEGECLANVPWKFFTGEEARHRTAS